MSDESAKAQVRRDPVNHWVLTYAHTGCRLVKADKASFEVPLCVPYFWVLRCSVWVETTSSSAPI